MTKKTISIRLDVSTIKSLQKFADLDNRKVCDYIRVKLEDVVDKEDEKAFAYKEEKIKRLAKIIA